MKKHKFSKRSAGVSLTGAIFRAVGFKPDTLNEKERTIDMVISTDTPVLEFDFHDFEVRPTIIAVGAVKNLDNQIPMLDSHNRHGVGNIIGSFTNLRYEGSNLIGTARFATTEEGEKAFLLAREGHLTDVSIGMQIVDSTLVKSGDSVSLNGVTYSADDDEDIRVITSGVIKEASLVPIGADENAKIRQQNNQEPIMDPKVKEVMIRMGLIKSDTPEDKANEVYRANATKVIAEVQRSAAPVVPVAPAAPVAPVAPVPVANTEDIVRKAVEDEATRNAEISDICAEYDLDVVKYRAEGVTPDMVRKAALESLRALSPESPAQRPHVEVGADASDKFRGALTDAMCQRAGVPVREGEAKRENNALMGMSLISMCQESLRRSNQPVPIDRMEMVGRALATSDFPIAVSNLANKSMLAGFDLQPSHWRKICSVGTANDFKVMTMARRGEFGDFKEIKELEPYQVLNAPPERKEEATIRTYGGKVILSRQMIINDDLGLFTSLIGDMAELGNRQLDDLAFAVLTSNPLMGDGIALFDAAHANVGTTGAFGQAEWDELDTLMGLQKDIGGLRRLNINPVTLVASRKLKSTFETFLKTNKFTDGDSSSTRFNPFFDAISSGDRVYESRLDDVDDDLWFLLGNKRNTIRMFFLGGVQSPVMERVNGLDIDGITYKARLDAVAKALDWKAMARGLNA